MQPILLKRKNWLRSVPAILVYFVILSTILTIAIPIPAQAFKFSLVGSWEVKDDNTGNIFLATINPGNTHTISMPFNNFSEAHGTWEKCGIGSYKATDIAFIYDENGDLAFKQKVRAQISVSKDGQSLTATLVMDILLLDGTVVQTINTTVTGKRINVESID